MVEILVAENPHVNDGNLLRDQGLVGKHRNTFVLPDLSKTLGGGDFLPVYNAQFAGVLTTNTGAQNTAALQTLINIVIFLGGGIIYIPRGVYLFQSVVHPNPAASFTNTIIAQFGYVELWGDGKGRTVLKMQNGAALKAGSTQNRFVTNFNPLSSGTADRRLVIRRMTLDGNCANNAADTSAGMHGVQYFHAEDIILDEVEVKNMLGWDTSSLETFHIDGDQTQDMRIYRCDAICDDGGHTASGFSQNYSDRFWMIGTRALGMRHGQGHTVFKSSNGFIDDWYAGDCGSGALNIEHSWHIDVPTGNGGGRATRADAKHTSLVFARGEAHPNDKGLVVLLTQGGGDINIGSGVTLYGNTTRNLGITAGIQGTAKAGTSASQVVATTAMFFDMMVENMVQVGAHPPVQIASVAATANVDSVDTIQTVTPHGGTSGDQITVFPGKVRVAATISGSAGKGIQPTDGSTALKALSMRCLDWTAAHVHDNARDLEDIGNGSATHVDDASGAAPAAATDALASGVEFRNPFGRDMTVYVTGASSTSLRGGAPADTPFVAGANGSFVVKAGGAITTDGSSVVWAF